VIYKSYIVEKDLNIIKNNLVLFYGENLGLIKEFKDKINKNYKNFNIVRLTESEILSNHNILYNELLNKSLFNENKIFLIDNASDKILSNIKSITSIIDKNKIFIFCNILEKKSKLRNFFEKEDSADIVPCYQDNEVTMRNILTNNLKEYPGINTQIINIVLENTGHDRSKLHNEINKIKTYFYNKKMDSEALLKLLNSNEENDFNIIKDSALCGLRNKTNKLLNGIILEIDKNPLYISMFNQRLRALYKVVEDKNNNLEKKISAIKPPIFWKDKKIFHDQAKLWNKKKLIKALDKSFELEINMKNSNADKTIILRNFIVDICNLANAA